MRHVEKVHSLGAAGPSQSTITSHFTAKVRKISDKEKENINLKAAELIAKNNLPISFFEKEGTKEFMDFVVKSFNVNASSKEYCPSAKKIEKSLEKTSAEVIKKLRENAAKLIENSAVTIIADDWCNNTGSYEKSGNYRAVLLQLGDETGAKESCMLMFRVVEGKKNVNIRDDIADAMDEIGMKDALQNGMIPITCDGGMIGAANELTGGNVGTTCGAHTINRMLVRWMDKCEDIPGFKEANEERI